MRTEGATRAIVVRPQLDLAAARPLLVQVAAVDWSDVYDAYGPATGVAGQLAAVIVGDDATRDEAWWNLWATSITRGPSTRRRCPPCRSCWVSPAGGRTRIAPRPC